MRHSPRRRARRSSSSTLFVVVSVAATLAAHGAAQAQTATLGSTDFTLVLSRIDSSGNPQALTTDELTTFLSAARCACPINVGVAIGINSDSVTKVAAGDSFDVTMMIGADCDNVAATACISIGSTLTLNAGTTQTGETLSSSDIFAAAVPSTSCSALTSTTTRLWAVVRQNGVRLTTQPSLPIGIGGAGPTAPTAVTATTGESNLLIAWTAPSTTTAIQGYQALCSPGPATPSAAAFDSCAAGHVQGTGPFASLDPAFVCSGEVAVGTNSVHVTGLQNGTTYQVAVVSIGIDGTPSGASAAATATPGPTLGFDELYKQAGGNGLGGCAVAGPTSRAGAAAGWLVAALALAAVVVGRRRRPGRRPGGRSRPVRPAPPGRASRPLRGRGLSSLRSWLAFALALGLARAAHAQGYNADDEQDDGSAHGYRFGEEMPLGAGGPSPRHWNLELRFAPYYPAVDSEFADRGQTARPFEETFSSKKRLMVGVELDRQVAHRGGTWAVGFGFGYYRAAARALALDQVTRTGDETTLRFFPLALMAVYRADILHERFSSPIVPYAKLGLDCALWSTTETSKSGASGTTLGWNAAAGVTLDLSFLDPEAMRTMDAETGVNGFALFVEVTHLALDGFGSSSTLRLGDTTWTAGLMLEM